MPGARESWAFLPIVFESAAERDPHMDWTHVAVVIRMNPRRRIRACSRSSEDPETAEDVIIDEAAPEAYLIGELLDTGA